jgi:hypothetical protein
MIPRTVMMAKVVENMFSSTELDQYGNIILNGYASTVPNSTGKLAWQYQQTTTAPVPLPSLQVFRPALKGWTTNYMEYFTKPNPPDYPVNPGDPTMFSYVVHSYGPVTGEITAFGSISGGSGYTPGTYTGVNLVGNGTGATADIVVGASGEVTSVTLVAGGTGYVQWESVTANAVDIGGTGSGFYVYIAAITPLAGGAPQWAQCPRRFNQNQVLPTDQGPTVNNPAAIQYSFIYPVADSPNPPPIDAVAP